MKAPLEEVRLSCEAGQALIERLQANTLTGEDRRLLVKLIRIYFWLTFALSETRISLKRLKRALFGGSKPPSPPPTGGGPSQNPRAEPGTGDSAPMAASDDPPT